MLSTAAIITPFARPGLPGAENEATTVPVTQPFAQALGQATARQREDQAAPVDADDAATAPSTPPADEAPATGAARRPPCVRKGVPQPHVDALRAAAASTAAPGTALAGGAIPVAQGDASEVSSADQDLLDLTAWLPGLPLAGQPVPAADSAAPASAAPGPLRGRHGAPGAIATGVTAGLAPAVDAAEVGDRPAAVLRGTAPTAAQRPALRAATPDDPAVASTPPSATCSVPPDGIDALAQAFGAARVPAAPEHRRDERVGPPGAGAVPSVAGAPAPAAVGALLQAELSVPLASPQFASALGTQLSVLVRDGVEHARLKLNPAEMGPIEVRIRLDGNQAQVDFSAAQAGTRQALQDAVPALAEALRGSGLTLAGGGVFEQPRDPRGDARRDTAPAHGAGSDQAADATAPATLAPRTPRARGVVDLYA